MQDWCWLVETEKTEVMIEIWVQDWCWLVETEKTEA